MKKLLFALAILWLIPTSASAQCTGKFPSGTVCGNNTGAPANPRPTSIDALINGLCSFSTTSCLRTFGYVKPEWFGARCDGTGDDGPAIQSALNSTTAGTAKIVVQLSANCVYRVVTGVTISRQGTWLKGAGRAISAIDYEPTGTGTAITVNSGSRIYDVQISDFSIFSSNTSLAKTAIKVVDVSMNRVANIICAGTPTGDFWTGGAAPGSICLDTNGRDTTTFENLTFQADSPIIMRLNPNIYLSTDHFIFRDLDLVANSAVGQPCVLATSGIVMTNTSFVGRQSWNLCSYGFLVNDTTSAVNWTNLLFENVRIEQTPNPATYNFLINVATGNRLIGLTVRNSELDAFANGISLHNVQNATIDTVIFLCLSAGPNNVGLNVDTSDVSLQLINAHVETGCTLTHNSGSAITFQTPSFFPPGLNVTIPATGIAW